jgi:hypothetical protein
MLEQFLAKSQGLRYIDRHPVLSRHVVGGTGRKVAEFSPRRLEQPMSEPRLVTEQIGSQWVITSPDVPGLYVAHAELDKALGGVASAIKMLAEMQKRRATRKLMERRVATA